MTIDTSQVVSPSKSARWLNALLYGALFYCAAAGLHLLLFLLLTQNSTLYSSTSHLLFDMYLQQNPKTEEVIYSSFLYTLPLGLLVAIISYWVQSARMSGKSINEARKSVIKRLVLVALPFILLPLPLVAAPEGGIVVFSYFLVGTVYHVLLLIMLSVLLTLAFYRNKQKQLMLVLAGLVAAVGAADYAALAMSDFCVATDHHCHGKLAIKNDDISICKKGVGYTAWCIWDFAVARRDPEICSQHLEGESQTHCFNKVAQATKDVQSDPRN